MQEEKREKGGVTPTEEDAKQEATSSRTVSDLDESDNESEGGGAVGDLPSPDGQFDSTGRGAGPGEETGPM